MINSNGSIEIPTWAVVGPLNFWWVELKPKGSKILGEEREGEENFKSVTLNIAEGWEFEIFPTSCHCISFCSFGQPKYAWPVAASSF